MFNRKEYDFYPEEKRTNGLALILLGAAIGAAVALLYAPQSGGDTRDTLLHKADDLKDSARGWGHDLSERADDLKTLAKRKMNDLHRG